MRRFEFRLERVLKLKKQREWLAELRQKQARAALDAARAEAAALRDQVSRCAAAFASRLGAGASLAHCHQAARLGDLVQLAEAKAAAAAVQYQEASAARAKVAAEVEALQLLRREQWQAHRLDVQRAQQEQLDEVGLRRWLAAQQDTSPPV